MIFTSEFAQKLKYFCNYLGLIDSYAGGSTWYLLCEKCRERYLRDKRQSVKEKPKKIKKKGVSAKHSMTAQLLEPHLVMKNNALFLLDMASASGMHWPTQQPVSN